MSTRTHKNSLQDFVVILVVLAAAYLVVTNFVLPKAGAISPFSPKPEPKTETFLVRAGQATTYAFKSLKAGQKIEGYFVAQGGNNDIGFQVQTPNGTYLANLGRVAGRYDFNYTLPADGPYTMVFGNGFSVVTDKHVNLVYTVY